MHPRADDDVPSPGVPSPGVPSPGVPSPGVPSADAGVPAAVDFLAQFTALPGLHLLLAPDAPHFTIVAASDEHLAASLRTREATVGRGLFTVFTDANPANVAPGGVASLRASLETVLRTRVPHRMPIQRFAVARADGTWAEHYWEPLNVPVLGPRGEVQYVLHRVEDVTARLEAEAELARLLATLTAERERLRALVHNMPAPVALLVGPEHRFELVNAAFRQIGRGGRDVTGLTPPEAFPELAAQGFYQLYDRVYATGEPWVGPETLVRADRDGTGVQDNWFDLHFEPVRDADGRVVAILNVAVDVTDHVRARREIERLLAESEHARGAAAAAREEAAAAFEQAQSAYAELEVTRAQADAARRGADEANRAEGEFLTTMSHELRTPLSAIGGYTGLLEMGLHGPVTGAQRAALERIQRSQRHLLGLINGVLNFARLEAGAVRYHVEDVPLDAVLATSEALTAPQLEAKGLAFDHEACDGALRVRADREKLEQVLLNLLGNAVKFTGPGGRVSLRCAPADAGAAVRVRVSDTGIGIAADQLARIFEPFVQVDAARTHPHEGAGLGLAISRDLARGMGGDLTADSTPGVGSTFTLTLPMA